MGISVLLIIITSLFAKEEKFEGYVQSSRHVNYRLIEPIYAIGQYDEDMMTGFWEFYADSTKKVKIASGSFLRGNGSKISSTGIPFDGRHGEWKHYYTRNNNRYNHNDKYRISNSIQAYQNWNQGKMNGQSSTYYRDGKKASTAYYKDGVKHGIRKEWFSGGFQNTKLFRESNFIKGELLSDKIYTFGERKLITRSYKNETFIDSIFQSKISYDTKVALIHTNNRIQIFHQNGKIYNDLIKHKDNSVTAKSYYDNGQLMIEVKFDSLRKKYWNNNNRVCYDPKGKIIDNIKFINGNIHGETIELVTGKTKINSNFERLFSKYGFNINNKSSRYYSPFYYRNYSIQRNIFNIKNYGNNVSIDNIIRNFLIPIGPFYTQNTVQGSFYNSLYGFKMNGLVIKTLTQALFDKFNFCVGYGTYHNGIRVGKWYWEDKNGSKILEGIFNDVGNPIGQWDSYGIDEVFTFSNDGELIKTMKTIIQN